MLFPPNAFSGGAHVESNKALLLIDLQNDFVKSGGKLRIENTAGFLPKLPPLIAAFRSKGDVIWAQTEFQRHQSVLSPTTGGITVVLKQFLELAGHDDYDDADNFDSSPASSERNTDITNPFPDPDAIDDPEAFLSTRVEARKQCCEPGTNGSQLPDLLQQAVDVQKDIIVLKSHYSAFTDTLLLQKLRSKFVNQLYICGSLSNVSVFATVLDAVTHGMKVVLVEDCLGYQDASCHQEAMRQMADGMGADGIDQQELMDDLAGLLGDVVKEENYPTRFEVSIATPPIRPADQPLRKQSVHDWVASIENLPPTSHPVQHHIEAAEQPSKRESAPNRNRESLIKNDSSGQRSMRHGTPELTPPRKRSTSDLESDLEAPQHKTSSKPSQRRASSEVPPTSEPKYKTFRNRGRGLKMTGPRDSTLPCLQPMTPPVTHSKSTGDISDMKSLFSDDHIVDAITSGPNPTTPSQSYRTPNKSRRKESTIPTPLDSTSIIGSGDSQLHADLLPSHLSPTVFTRLRTEVQWANMYHRTGAVPRLVAVQGSSSTHSPSTIPIYRHPADESPPLHPFTETVNMIRGHCEVAIGHPLNHVLIQLYRSGDDNISEHSDKTLDIVRNSKIVNYSCGAQRTMTLRMKKSALPKSIRYAATDAEAEGIEPGHEDDRPSKESLATTVRPSQRIPLPHNSLFVLGPSTNAEWLHSIRADKRPSSQKSSPETDYNSERISLTFRHIGTFTDTSSNTIWGQGATSKEESGAKKILAGAEAEQEGERMIRAFGQENHRCGREWEWSEWYGAGFDVVDFQKAEP